jgi:hypothetical protein
LFLWKIQKNTIFDLTWTHFFVVFQVQGLLVVYFSQKILSITSIMQWKWCESATSSACDKLNTFSTKKTFFHH